MRFWLVVLLVGIVAGALAAALGARGVEIGCGALAAAAVVHALHVLAGEEPAAIAGATAGGLLAVVVVIEHGADHGLSVPWLAVAAAAWTVAELARPTATPYVALAPAIAAALLEPACVALPAIVGARLVRPSVAQRAQVPSDSGPGQLPLKGTQSPIRVKPRTPGVIAVPITGAVMIIVAIVAGTAHDGSLASLGQTWFGPRLAPTTPIAALTRLADALGPVAVVAVAGGLAVLVRVHLASLAIVACVAGAILVDLRAGTPGATTLGLAAMCAGAGITRLAGTIRIRSGQAITAATCGTILLVPPLWTAAELLASR